MLSLLGGILALVLGLGLLGLATSLPRLDGTVEVEGIGGRIEILRDGNGVPHILGGSDADVYFGLGFAHAQDRLWQMDFNRHLAQGRVSELVGPRGVKMDRLFRSLGLAHHSAESLPALNVRTHEALDAYARGVNAYLDRHWGVWAPEFLLLRHRPERWQPANSLALVELMSVMLCANGFEEPNRAALTAKLSPEQLRAFLPDYPPGAPTITAELRRFYRQFGAVSGLPLGARGASNNWAVSGARSATGKPLLANDTHLPLTTPALFYLAHLGLPGSDVAGASLPGVPGIILGQTDRIAWGFTTTGSDVQDLFIEQVDPNDPGRYRTPGGWARFGTREEIIRIRGAAVETLTVRTTRHGPLLPDGFGGWTGAPNTVLAIGWTMLRQADTSIEAAVGLPRARNWDEFVGAFRPYVTPMQNIFYADVDGHIGFLAPGMVPIRGPSNPAGGHVPAPGWDPRSDWIGAIPFPALPRRADPKSGMLFSANNKIVDPDYPYFLTDSWDAPYRAERIAELLKASPRHSTETFTAMQQDVYSPVAADLLPILGAARPRTPMGKSALQLMAGWDGRMFEDQPQPLIFTAWFRSLSRRIYADELESLFEENWSYRPQFLRAVLARHSKAAAWCDDVRTTRRENCDGQISAALDDATAELARTYGADAAEWRWGEAHEACGSHRPFGAVPILRKVFDACVESPGGAFTLNRGLTELGSTHPYANIHAAAFRGIYDLADRGRSRFIQPTGQSGNVLSADYRSFVRRWAEGRGIPIPVDRQLLDRSVAHRLVIQPDLP